MPQDDANASVAQLAGLRHPKSAPRPPAADMCAASAVTWPKLRNDLYWYGVLFIVALLLSSLYYISYVNHVSPDKAPHTQLINAYAAPPGTGKAAEQCPGPNPADCQVAAILERMHPLQTAPDALVKSLIVVSLAMLWFSTFTLIRRHADWTESIQRELRQGKALPSRRRPAHRLVKWGAIALAIIPAALFVLAMAGAYEPAVFVMALAAIYVAAEHYCGLEKARDDLERGVTDLGKHVGTLLNADGMSAWRLQMYKEYREAHHRIDAVVRFFDIDRQWWQCHAAPDPWLEYVRRAGTQEELLLNVLADEKCHAKVQFVADLPMAMPTVIPRPAEVGNEQFLAQYFRELLGLAWQLSVFSEVVARRRQRAAPPCTEDFRYLRIKIAGAPSWMHVIDDKTYQVIEREDLSQATVRELHRDIPSTPRKIRLSDWARRNVRHFAFRGTLGQEHLLSTLRSAALMGGTEKDHFDLITLDPILCELGLEEYLSSGAHRDFVIVGSQGDGANAEPAFLPTPRVARLMCVAIFDTFLKQTFPGQDPILVRDLAGALL